MMGKRKPALRFKGFEGEWETCRLGDIVQIIMGQSPDGSTYSETPSDYILVQGNADLKNGWVTPRIWTTRATKKASAGDLIMSVRAPAGTMGKTAYNVVLGRGVAAIKGNEFLYQNLVKMDSDGYWRKLSSGSTFESLNSNDIKNAELFVSSNTEQIRIGDFFQQLDALITQQQRKYDSLLNVKKSMLEKMFPKDGADVPEIRFKGFEGKWGKTNAEGIFYTTSDKNHPELPVLSASQEYGMIKRDESGINISHDKQNETTYKRVIPGQFVIHLRSFQGGFAHSKVEGITSPAYTILDFLEKEKHYDYFWKDIFTSKEFIKRLETVTYGIRDGRSISYNDFLMMSFTYPTFEEQYKIGTFFKHLDTLLTQHQKKLDHLTHIKTALLEKMFVSEAA